MFHHSHLPITGTILVADDQTANCEMLEEILIAKGCTVITVPGGAADAILLKAGCLIPDEWTVISDHSVVSERICAPLRSFRFVLPRNSTDLSTLMDLETMRFLFIRECCKLSMLTML
jgi:CheY-like chemotaxis protein